MFAFFTFVPLMGTGLALLTLLVLALIALAFWRKVELQFEYLQRKEGRGKQITRHWFKAQKNEVLKELRNRALLLFPLLFGVDREDEGAELNALKSRVRNLHLAIYLLLMAVVLLGLIGKGPVQ